MKEYGSIDTDVRHVFRQYRGFFGKREVYINSWLLEDDMIDIEYDDSCRGCSDTGYDSFPLLWLTFTDEQLTGAFVESKELIEDEKERIAAAKVKSDLDAKRALLEKLKRELGE